MILVIDATNWKIYADIQVHLLMGRGRETIIQKVGI